VARAEVASATTKARHDSDLAAKKSEIFIS